MAESKVMKNALWASGIAIFACLTFAGAEPEREPSKIDPGEPSFAETNGSGSDLTDALNPYSFTSFWECSSLNGSQCENDMKHVLKNFQNLDLWAFKMIDASAKLPPGIASGNLNQFGDFDECLSARGHNGDRTITGKYCLLNVEIKARDLVSENVRALDDVIHSHRLLTSELTDPGHRIPRVESFVWGLCLPSSCTGAQVKSFVQHRLDEFSNRGPFRFKASVSDELCYAKHEEKPIPWTTLMAACFFWLIAVLLVLEFFVDLDKLPSSNILKCFSLKRNWEYLKRTAVPKDDIECLHGAKFLNAIALLLSHKQMAMLYTPTINRAAMAESFSRFWTMIGRSAILYTDSFIMFSGILVSYSFVKSLDDRKTIDFKEKLINRIVRFTPNLLGIVIFCTYLMNHLNTGPFWGLVVTKYADLCKKNMWKNFLYIHNFYEFENMCLTHTHQLGIDMQLFAISPIFVFALWKWPKLGSTLLMIVSAASTWLRYEVTRREKLSTTIYYGISVDRLWKTANLSYIRPTHRLTVYLVGIAVGYYLRRSGKNLKFSWAGAFIGWTLASVSGLYAMFGPYRSAYKGFEYNPMTAALYNAFAPILWVVFLTWSILACINGYGGIFNAFLTWKYFRIFTKISYGVYLTQFPVFFYNIGTQRTVQYYKGFRSLFDIPELCIILAASIILALAFEIPCQEIKKFLKKSIKSKKNRMEEKEDENSRKGNGVEKYKAENLEDVREPRKRLHLRGN